MPRLETRHLEKPLHSVRMSPDVIFSSDAVIVVTDHSKLSQGVALNLGAAVIMPEVFLKALNLCRNLGRKVRDFTTADLDFVRHYRLRVNVVERPTRNGGRGIMLTGHHEIMFPLLVAAVREELRRGT